MDFLHSFLGDDIKAGRAHHFKSDRDREFAFG